ncbi:MAG: uroporphyrinogen-III C-methyltransferase [Gammaproteobacteria bacterium]
MSNDELKEEAGNVDSDVVTDDSEDIDQLTHQSPDRQNKQSAMLGSIISIVLSVLIAAFGAYYWYQNQYLPQHQSIIAKMDALGDQQSTIETSLTALKGGAGLDAAVESVAAQQVALKNSLSKRVDSVSQQAKKVAEAQRQLQQSVASLYEKESQSSLDWVLAEAEYLVLAANQRLALEGDINTAIAALKAADQRLGSADHPDLIPIRDQIIEDAAALEAVKLPDIEGLAIYLAKVIAQVKDLPTKQVPDPVKPFSGTKNLGDEAKDWRHVANAVWTDLVELVEVKDAALPDSVSFDPELRYFLQQNLRLELASARLSALRRDGQNFRASVDLIENMFTEFYDTSATNVKSILGRLSEAKNYEFEPALPKITASLDVIRAHIRNQPKSGAAE